MISADLSGIQAIINACEAMQTSEQARNREFMEGEGMVFIQEVSDPHTHPYLTGEALNSWRVDEIEQEEHATTALWRNTAVNEAGQHYLGFVNYGTVHIEPRYFNERALNRSQQGVEGRYQKHFSEKWDEAIGNES